MRLVAIRSRIAAALAVVSFPAVAAAQPYATNGAPVAQVAAGMQTPTSFTFLDGLVLAGDFGGQDGRSAGGVYLLQNGSALRLAGSPAHVSGLAVRSGTLYVSAGRRLLAWSGWDGAQFASRRTIYTAPRGFTGFNGIAFGADGRLYAGVYLGSNDHSPTRAPYAFDVLSLTSSGRNLRIFARGIRQPFQLAFPPGSSSPFVSVLGQDSGAVNPPDYLLRVHAGDNYGFPRCNHTVRAPCRSYTQPYRLLPAHTHPMGLAIVGKRLYIAEFGAEQTTAAQVVSMPLAGGPLRPLLKGFITNIVGLGANAGVLYVGEASGRVFSVRL